MKVHYYLPPVRLFITLLSLYSHSPQKHVHHTDTTLSTLITHIQLSKTKKEPEISITMSAINAKLLLSHSNYEKYLAWQDRNDLPGYFESAAIWYHFMIYLNTGSLPEPPSASTVPNPSGGEVADWCKHPVHPSDGLSEGYCPVCEVEICLKYLDAVTDMCSKRLSPGMRQAWRSARLHLQDAVNFHEDEAEEEAKWEVEHPNVNVNEFYSATRAVQLARNEVKYPSESMSRDTFETVRWQEDMHPKDGQGEEICLIRPRHFIRAQPSEQ